MTVTRARPGRPGSRSGDWMANHRGVELRYEAGGSSAGGDRGVGRSPPRSRRAATDTREHGTGCPQAGHRRVLRAARPTANPRPGRSHSLARSKHRWRREGLALLRESRARLSAEGYGRRRPHLLRQGTDGVAALLGHQRQGQLRGISWIGSLGQRSPRLRRGTRMGEKGGACQPLQRSGASRVR